ncbi:MAG: hypothetical protein U0794_22840 [Isosphaeraceae bacterium]
MSNVYMPAECPQCHMGLRVRTEYLGRWVSCRYCGQLFLVGGSEGSGPVMGRTDSSTPAEAWMGPGPEQPARDETTGEAAPAASPSDPRWTPPRTASLPTFAVPPVPVGPRVRERTEGADDAVEFAAEHHRFEVDRQRWETEKRALAHELERLRRDRDADRESHQQALAALRHAWDAERVVWRERLDEIRVLSERERDSLQELVEHLRQQSDHATRQLSTRDAHLGELRSTLDTHRGEILDNLNLIAELARAQHQATETHASIAAQNDQARAEAALLRDELQKTRAEAAALLESRDALRQAHEQAGNMARDLEQQFREELNGLAAALAQSQKQAETAEALRGNLDEALAEIQALVAERSQLQEEVENARSAQAVPVAAAVAPEVDAGVQEQMQRLEAEVVRLQFALAAARAPKPPVKLPVLCRDLARWSVPTAPAPAAVAVVTPVGPPPLPPSIDDLLVVDDQIAMLRRLLRLMPENGKPYHTLFDLQRFQVIQAKLKEANLLADRLVAQVERSRTQKDLMWHLMVAQRNDEMNRRRR